METPGLEEDSGSTLDERRTPSEPGRPSRVAILRGRQSSKIHDGVQEPF